MGGIFPATIRSRGFAVVETWPKNAPCESNPVNQKGAMCIVCVCVRYIYIYNIYIYSLSLSLSLTHTHTHMERMPQVIAFCLGSLMMWNGTIQGGRGRWNQPRRKLGGGEISFSSCITDIYHFWIRSNLFPNDSCAGAPLQLHRCSITMHLRTRQLAGGPRI